MNALRNTGLKEIYATPAEVPGWYYAPEHVGPGCLRREDLIAMGYWLHPIAPTGRSIPADVGCVWYVALITKAPYQGVLYVADHPDLFPGKVYEAHPPRGLFASRSVEAATAFVQLTRMEWPRKIICSRREGDVQLVTLHHHGNGRYSRKPPSRTSKSGFQRTQQPGNNGKAGHTMRLHNPLTLAA